jgi:hypothetical protein
MQQVSYNLVTDLMFQALPFRRQLPDAFAGSA